MKNMEFGKVTKNRTNNNQVNGVILEVPQGVELSPGHKNYSWWERVGQAESIEKSWKNMKTDRVTKIMKNNNQVL